MKKKHLRREQKAQGLFILCCWAIYESIATAFVKLGVNQGLGIGWCIRVYHTASIQCLASAWDFFEIIVIVDAARQITSLTIWLGSACDVGMSVGFC